MPGCDATANELPPSFLVHPSIVKRNQAPKDENEMSDASDCHHHGVKPPRLAGMNERPKRHYSGLHEMRHKQI